MNKYLRLSLIILLLIGLCSGILTARAQQTPQKYTFTTDYLLSLPDGYNNDTTQRWPLVLFLHGSGERGTDVEKVKTHGPPKLVAEGKKFPFILVSPQAPPGFGWEVENLYHLLQDIKKTYRVNDSRIYLTGLSMGGYGTWALAMKHPEEFAAIIPICGGGDTTDAWKLRHIPIWCFHGALDKNVPVAQDSQMIRAAMVYNPLVKFTVYPDLEHNSWERTYNNDSVYQWMLAQKKFVYKETSASAAKLKSYTGTYLGQDGDTVVISADKDGLHAKTSQRTFPLKPFDEDAFFIDMNMPVDVKFIHDRKGKYDSFRVLEQKKNLYHRI
ncbi:MAG: prolyl oligopeptidase family serine peptidase [Chitinophagaceae bacterium]|nr:prolyl oligopeptidase family serine peptidase [Chitinophagaceae bacterium]